MPPTRPAIRLVGAAGFEPATSCAQGTRAAKLRHAPPNPTAHRPGATAEAPDRIHASV